MRIAAHIAKTSDDQQRIKFDWKIEKTLTQEELTRKAQARWFMAVGYNKIEGREQAKWQPPKS